MDRKYRYGLALGILILLGTILSSLLWNKLDPTIVTIAITVGIILVASILIRLIKYRDLPEKDERTVKISNAALSYSWFLTLIFISVLFWVDYLDVVEMTVAEVIGAIYFVMIALALVFVRYFSWKGDVE
ncbi:MAG: hypothetical protein ACXQS6_00430 [Candidatus Syntropharchaeales archaeon]